MFDGRNRGQSDPIKPNQTHFIGLKPFPGLCQWESASPLFKISLSKIGADTSRAGLILAEG
jgi:hypothetical protein